MTTQPLRATVVLNDAFDLAILLVWPWGIVLGAAALMHGLLLAAFIRNVNEAGNQAAHYGTALYHSALLVAGGFVLLSMVRVVFAAACRAALVESGSARQVEGLTLKLQAASILNGVMVSLLLQLLLLATALSIVAVPIIAVLIALASVAAEREGQPALLRTLRATAHYSRNGGVIAALLLLFFFALLAAAINLWALFQLVLWLAGGVPSLDVLQWHALLSGKSSLFIYALLAGALAAIEPFWIASFASLVHRAEAQQSGDDLRSWLRSIVKDRGEEALLTTRQSEAAR